LVVKFELNLVVKLSDCFLALRGKILDARRNIDAYRVTSLITNTHPHRITSGP
jgi:hypothetical protein